MNADRQDLAPAIGMAEGLLLGVAIGTLASLFAAYLSVFLKQL